MERRCQVPGSKEGLTEEWNSYLEQARARKGAMCRFKFVEKGRMEDRAVNTRSFGGMNRFKWCSTCQAIGWGLQSTYKRIDFACRVCLKRESREIGPILMDSWKTIALLRREERARREDRPSEESSPKDNPPPDGFPKDNSAENDSAKDQNEGVRIEGLMEESNELQKVYHTVTCAGSWRHKQINEHFPNG